MKEKKKFQIALAVKKFQNLLSFFFLLKEIGIVAAKTFLEKMIKQTTTIWKRYHKKRYKVEEIITEHQKVSLFMLLAN